MANFKLVLCIALYLSCNLISITSSAEAPTVKTPQGVLRGKHLLSRDGRQYEAYIGVRYGLVPERFEVSVPSPAWEGAKDATEFGEQCPQATLTGSFIGDEDCLFLNIYTPKADNKRRPVLIFIHGGGFTYGAGDGYGGKYFMDEEIVVITVNYRLGVLGFLDTRDGLVTGNMGLKDLVVALKWVKENIDDFGGDASRVTVSGESAGGAAALHLLISPLAKGLFHHVLAESGSPRNPWAYTESTLDKALTLAKKLECNTQSSTEIVKCLKTKSLQEILVAQISSFARFHVDPMFVFTPTMETRNSRNPEPFLRDTPADILRAGQYSRLPVLMTINREEGSLLHGGTVATNEALAKQLNDEFGSAAPITFLYESNPGLQTHRKEVTKKIRKFYFGGDEITTDKFENLTNIYTDSWFLHGIHESALSLAEHTTVYTGLITHVRKDWSMLSLFGVSKNFEVTAHCDELSYLYNQASDAKAMTLISKEEVKDEADVQFSKAFIKTIVSFASSGIPKIHVGKSTKWTSVGKKERENGHLNFMNLGLEDFVHVKPFEKRMKFWQKLYKWDKDWNKDEL